MEESSRIKAPSMQLAALDAANLEMKQNMPRHTSCNFKDPEVITVSSASPAASGQNWQPIRHDEESQKSCEAMGPKVEIDMNSRCCCRCHKRRIIRGQGVRMGRSACTTGTRDCVTVASKEAREAVRALGVLDRAAGGLTEWMQVISIPQNTILQCGKDLQAIVPPSAYFLSYLACHHF
jgi:hypothetical protein